MNDSPWNSDYAVADTVGDFEVGDVVYLASGSPELTVVGLCECGFVTVAWYDDFDGMQEASFCSAALVMDDEF